MHRCAHPLSAEMLRNFNEIEGGQANVQGRAIPCRDSKSRPVPKWSCGSLEDCFKVEQFRAEPAWRTRGAPSVRRSAVLPRAAITIQI